MRALPIHPLKEAGETKVPRTLDDLAAVAACLALTVSRVINGGSVVRGDSRRVIAVLAKTDYRPNVAARTLASGRSGVVGVVIHVLARLAVPGPVLRPLLQGDQRCAGRAAAGDDAVAGQPVQARRRSSGSCPCGLLDGAIVTANKVDDPLVDGMLASRLPTVLVGHRRDGS